MGYNAIPPVPLTFSRSIAAPPLCLPCPEYNFPHPASALTHALLSPSTLFFFFLPPFLVYPELVSVALGTVPPVSSLICTYNVYLLGAISRQHFVPTQ